MEIWYYAECCAIYLSLLYSSFLLWLFQRHPSVLTLFNGLLWYLFAHRNRHHIFIFAVLFFSRLNKGLLNNSAYTVMLDCSGSELLSVGILLIKEWRPAVLYNFFVDLTLKRRNATITSRFLLPPHPKHHNFTITSSCHKRFRYFLVKIANYIRIFQIIFSLFLFSPKWMQFFLISMINSGQGHQYWPLSITSSITLSPRLPDKALGNKILGKKHNLLQRSAVTLEPFQTACSHTHHQKQMVSHQ